MAFLGGKGNMFAKYTTHSNKLSVIGFLCIFRIVCAFRQTLSKRSVSKYKV